MWRRRVFSLPKSEQREESDERVRGGVFSYPMRRFKDLANRFMASVEVGLYQRAQLLSEASVSRLWRSNHWLSLAWLGLMLPSWELS
jgi:hypothetical protein